MLWGQFLCYTQQFLSIPSLRFENTIFRCCHPLKYLEGVILEQNARSCMTPSKIESYIEWWYLICILKKGGKIYYWRLFWTSKKKFFARRVSPFD